MFVHWDDRCDVAPGKFTGQGSVVDMTRLESGMSFLQVKVSVTMREKLRLVKDTVCVNRWEIAHTRPEAVAGADNPYSLIAMFGKSHLAIKAGAAVYVKRCAPVEMVPWSCQNCTEEAPVIYTNTDKRHKISWSPDGLQWCSAPRYKLSEKWY